MIIYPYRNVYRFSCNNNKKNVGNNIFLQTILIAWKRIEAVENWFSREKNVIWIQKEETFSKVFWSVKKFFINFIFFLSREIFFLIHLTKTNLPLFVCLFVCHNWNTTPNKHQINGHPFSTTLSKYLPGKYSHHSYRSIDLKSLRK